MKNVNWRWVGVAAAWAGLVMAGPYVIFRSTVQEQVEECEVVYLSADPWPGIWAEAEAILRQTEQRETGR